MKAKKTGIAVVVALLALGLTSVAVAYKSNDDGSNPAVRFVAEDSGGERAKGGSDDAAGHDANDDHGSDDDHDDNDDHGGDDD